MSDFHENRQFSPVLECLQESFAPMLASYYQCRIKKGKITLLLTSIVRSGRSYGVTGPLRPRYELHMRSLLYLPVPRDDPGYPTALVLRPIHKPDDDGAGRRV